MELKISNECKDAIKDYGLLWKDGAPASKELMSKDSLKIAIVEGEDNFDRVMSSGLQDYIDIKNDLGGEEDIVDMNIAGTSTFPEGIQERLETAVKYWYDGVVDFVTVDDNPDLHVVAVEAHGGLAGMATFPENDNPGAEYEGFKGTPALIINMSSAYDEIDHGSVKSTGEFVESVARHEFGHNFAILHPVSLGRNDGGNTLPGDVCTSEERKDLQLRQDFGKSVMYERTRDAPEQEGDVTNYDRFIKEAATDPILLGPQ